jgi:hypothetical protein
MRRFLSSQSATVIRPTIQNRDALEEQLVLDARGGMSPSNWVEQKLRALLRDSSADLTPFKLPLGSTSALRNR